MTCASGPSSYPDSLVDSSMRSLEKKKDKSSNKKKTVFDCEVCGAQLSRLAHLQRHQKLLHSSTSDNESFACRVCGKRFTRRDVYQRHERSVHSPVQAACRKARKKSCRRCIKYKARCSRELPCQACRRCAVQCIYDTANPPAPCAELKAADASGDSADSIIDSNPPMNDEQGVEEEDAVVLSTSLSDLAHVAGIIDRAEDGVSLDKYLQGALEGRQHLWLGQEHQEQQSPAQPDSAASQYWQNHGQDGDECTNRVPQRQEQENTGETLWNTVSDPDPVYDPDADQLEFLANYGMDPDSTLSFTDFPDWNLLRASRMDWVGCETEPSVGLGAGCSPELNTTAVVTGTGAQTIQCLKNPAPEATSTVVSSSIIASSGVSNTKTPNPSSSPDHQTNTGNKDATWPAVLDRGGNEAWPFDYTSNRGYRKIRLPPLKQVLEQTVDHRPVIQRNTLLDLIKVLSAPHIPSLNDTPALEAMPAVAFLNEFVKIYFAEFHAVLPVIHRPTWRIEKCPTALLAAMACIGATYSSTEGSSEVSALLAEITQRALFWMGQQDSTSFRNWSYITASCFHQVYALGTGNRRLYEIADASRGLLVTSLRGLGMLSSDLDPMGDAFLTDVQNLKRLSPSDLEDTWLAWRDKEMKKRMAWSVFEFDCTLCTMTFKRGAFQIAELPSRLPCSESIWEAHSAQAWAAILPFSTTPPAGLPFYSLLRDVMSNKSLPEGTPSWGKRLCAHAMARTLHDMRETEDAWGPNMLGLPSLAAAQQETKRGLLDSFAKMQESLARPTCTTEVVNMNIGCLTYHYSYLSSRGHEAMDLVVFIFRNSGQESISAHVDSAKEHLRQIFVRSPVTTRRLAVHAGAIVAITRDCTINTPCETMRAFMGYAYLLAFMRFGGRYQPSSGNPETRDGVSAAAAVRIDEIPWTRLPQAAQLVERWIETGGVASVGDVPDVYDQRNFSQLKGLALEGLKSLQVWGLAKKFYETINKFD